MVLGMPIFSFILIFIVYPIPVLITAILAFKSDKKK